MVLFPFPADLGFLEVLNIWSGRKKLVKEADVDLLDLGETVQVLEWKL